MHAPESNQAVDQPKITVSKLAMLRRLQAAGARPEDRDLVIGGGGRYAMVRVMLQELAQAHLLSQSSHRLFSLPGQVRRNETGEQLLVNDLLYLVDKNSIVTVCMLTAAQLTSLEQVEGRDCPFTTIPLLTREQLMDAVCRFMDEAGPVSSVRPMPRSVQTAWRPRVLEAPASVSRATLKPPRWLYAGGCLNILVIPPHALIRDQSIEIAQHAARWVREELSRNPLNVLWYDPTAETAKPIVEKFRRARCFPLDVELLENQLSGTRVTRSAYKLWKQLFQGAVPTQGRLIVFATPTIATKLANLVAGHVPASVASELLRPDFATWGRRAVRITVTPSEAGDFRYECEIRTLL